MSETTISSDCKIELPIYGTMSLLTVAEFCLCICMYIHVSE
jgi:hypothetical protein